MNLNSIRSFGLGGLIALLVLIACFVLWLLGKGDFELGLIAALALARLL